METMVTPTTAGGTPREMAMAEAPSLARDPPKPRRAKPAEKQTAIKSQDMGAGPEVGSGPRVSAVWGEGAFLEARSAARTVQRL